MGWLKRENIPAAQPSLVQAPIGFAWGGDSMIRGLIQDIFGLLRTEVPGIAEAFHPPASLEEIQRAEAELGMKLPGELKELYQVCNGEKENGPGLFFGLPLLSLTDLVAEWKIWADLESDYAIEGDHYSVPPGWIKERYINRCWLPISKDWGGNHLGLDLDPDEQGKSGQVINFGRDEHVKYVIAHNLTEMLQFIHDTAKAKNYSIHEEEDQLFWAFGQQGPVHFLDAIRKLELPVYHPVRIDPGIADPQAWLDSLSESWRERIQANGDSPEPFLRAKQLYFINEGLTDLTPLKHCREVRELVLSANKLTSIEAISGCQQLKRLYVGKNPIADLTPLEGLPYLQMLNLAQTDVTDLSPLASLPRLAELDLTETRISDLSALARVKSLQSLAISRPDAAMLNSVAELATLTELKISGLGENAADAIKVLGKLVHLQTISLEDMSLADLAFLRGCRQLKTVKLRKTAIADISHLAELENLQSLEFSGCDELGQLEQLGKSASLRKITGSYQQFARLKDCFERKIDFSTITGNMTDEEDEIWHAYVRS
ncbi:internalin A [Brevibacillus sp. 1238]|nr:internalin A [Brevibacillus sp. 1238]